MAKKCPICGNISLEEHSGEYRFDTPPNIPGGTIVIQSAIWEECDSCGEQILSLELEHAIEKERYHRLGLLTPERIKEIRNCAGLTQTDMAQFLGVGEKAFTRWESGKSLQNKSNDNLLRLVERSPELFLQLDAERSPERGKIVSDYIKSLGNLKGKNKLAMAAHGGELDQTIVTKLREHLQQIIDLKRNY